MIADRMIRKFALLGMTATLCCFEAVVWGGEFRLSAQSNNEAYHLWEQELKSSKNSDGEARFFKLEEEITSASKYRQNLLESPSAVYVITDEDIRRSGTLDLTEVFRFAPGTMVVDTSSNSRDVMIRGYPRAFSPNILVLMDGIPIYTPHFNGVYWPFLPISLPSTRRVEVVRGASSTLYGVNAFSGVINIISKEISETPKVDTHLSIGNLQTQEAEVVWDQPLGDKVRFRLEGYFHHDGGYGNDAGFGNSDGQMTGQGRFDLEADLGRNTRFKFFAYGKGGDLWEPIVGPFAGAAGPDFTDFIGGFRLEHSLSKQQLLSFQTSYQNLDASGYPPPVGSQIGREVSSDLQFTQTFGRRDTLVAGANFFLGAYANPGILDPGFNDIVLASLFINNDFRIRDNLILTTGGRFEFDSITSNQLVGRINLTYLPVQNQAVRVSVARAVRSPSVAEENTRVLGVPGFAPPPLPPQTVVNVIGNKQLSPQSVIAAELGYHGEFFEGRVSVDVQGYFNQVNDFIVVNPSFDPMANPPSLTLTPSNNGNGQVFGLELDLLCQVFSWWETGFNYTLTRQTGFETGKFPDNLLSLKNRFNTPVGFSAELLFNWTSPYAFYEPLTNLGVPVGHIFQLDVRLAQQILKDRLEFAVVGQNLIDAPHTEDGITQVDRRVYGTLQFRY